MHPQLDGYRSDFAALEDKVNALVADAAPATLRARPDPEKWSAVQCIDHLNTAGWLLLQSVERAIERSQSKGPYGTPPFRYGIVSRWFVRVLEPSSGWTFDAPSLFEPEAPNTLYPDEAVEEFVALQNQFAACIGDAEGLDLRRIRLSSPAIPLLRISLGAWFEATLAHERRHLAQARRTLNTVQAA